jgi:phosphatidylglycerol lysyltransferase
MMSFMNIAISAGGVATATAAIRALTPRARPAAARLDQLEDWQLEQLIERFGWNTNSFLLHYGGYRFFKPFGTWETGVVPYVSTSRALIVAGDPLCRPDLQWDALKIFREFARQNNLQVVILPASERLAADADAHGFGKLIVGTEAQFDPVTWVPRGDPGKPVRWSVNKARRSGVSAELYFPGQARRPEIETAIAEFADQWRNERKINPLGYLVSVDPLNRVEDKLFVTAWFEGKLTAFLAASPIYAREGWYIEDIIRLKSTPAGASELLITTLLDHLRISRCQFATLGTAPLVGVESQRDYPVVRWALTLIYRRMNAFYNFRGLHHFKSKFRPTFEERNYVLFSPAKLRPNVILTLLEVFEPGGLWGVLKGKFTKKSKSRS